MSMQSAKNRIRKIAGQSVGLVLIVAAIAFAVRDVRLDVLREAGVFEVAGIAVAVLANMFLTGSLFWQITHSFKTTSVVPFWRMQQLVAFSGLLNYVPIVRPGLWGRAAYLKSKYDLDIRDSIYTLVIVLAVGIAVFSVTTLVLVVLMTQILRWPVLIAALFVLSVFAHFLLKKIIGTKAKMPGLWVTVKAIDMFVAAIRLWIAFEVVGEGISFEAALLATAASLVVKMVGLTPNGLGLSEWTVALLASVVTPVTAATGVAAALVDRVVEILVSIPVGLLSLCWLKKS